MTSRIQGYCSLVQALLSLVFVSGCAYNTMSRPDVSKMDREKIEALRASQQFMFSYVNEAQKLASDFLQAQTSQRMLAENLTTETLKERALAELENKLRELRVKNEQESHLLEENQILSRSERASQKLNSASLITSVTMERERKLRTDAIENAKKLAGDLIDVMTTKGIQNRSADYGEFNKVLQTIADIETDKVTSQTLRSLAKQLDDKANVIRVPLHKEILGVQEQIAVVGKDLETLRNSPIRILLKIATTPTSNVVAGAPTRPVDAGRFRDQLIHEFEAQIRDARQALADLALNEGSDPQAILRQAQFLQKLNRVYARVRTESEKEVTSFGSVGNYSGLPLQRASSRKPFWTVLGVEDTYNTTLAEGGAVITHRGKSVGLLGLPVYVAKEMVNLIREIFSRESTPELAGAAAASAALLVD